MKLFICGSRTIINIDWISSKIQECIAENHFTDITLFNDCLSSVDAIAREWAESHNVCIKDFPPPALDSTHSLFYKRNDRMVQECEYGENHEIKHETKHFSPGTKIYCAQGLWDDGYENIVVIGKHRKSPKYTKIIMQRKHRRFKKNNLKND